MKLQNDADKRLHEINDHGYQECQCCGLLYRSERELKDHLISHHEQIEPSINISCDIFHNVKNIWYFLRIELKNFASIWSLSKSSTGMMGLGGWTLLFRNIS